MADNSYEQIDPIIEQWVTRHKLTLTSPHIHLPGQVLDIAKRQREKTACVECDIE